MNIIFTSFGNDSIALIQWAFENNLQDVTVVYNDTGWASPEWEQRVPQGFGLAKKYSFNVHTTESIGFIALAKERMGFPRQGMQFCTEVLKRGPSLKWLDEVDPELEAICLVGVRREESANRAQFPEWVEESDGHGGRSLWAPLVRHKEERRDELIFNAGFEVLPHRSHECYPCINSNRANLRLISEDRIKIIETAEKDMGVGVRSGKPKTMFRPYRHHGAVGIRNVIKWANDGRYIAGMGDLFESDCDSGYCE